jgi:hypothetical protein
MEQLTLTEAAVAYSAAASEYSAEYERFAAAVRASNAAAFRVDDLLCDLIKDPVARDRVRFAVTEAQQWTAEETVAQGRHAAARTARDKAREALDDAARAFAAEEDPARA